MGSAISCAVHENGVKLTSLPPGKFAVVNVAPGVHSFVVSSEATDIMRVNVEPGQVYYGGCVVEMGIFAGRPTLTPADRATFFALAPKLHPVKGAILAQADASPWPVAVSEKAVLVLPAPPLPVAVPLPSPPLLVAVPVSAPPLPVVVPSSPSAVVHNPLPMPERVVAAPPPAVERVSFPLAPTIVTAPAAANAITVPAGTEIWLAPLREISSKHVKTGDTITMQVSRDVVVHRVLVIPRGTEATGKISYRTGKGALGKSAKIEFDLTTLRIAQRPLPILAHYRVAGDGNSAWAVATFLLVSMVGSLFITGHSAVVPAGSEWQAKTVGPLVIAIDDEALPPRMAGSFQRVALRTVVDQPAGGTWVAAGEREIPLNSAYTPPPAELFVRSLPPRP